jgi:hypothetical protein
MTSKLEWLGFEVAVRRHLMLEPAAAQILAELMRHAGTGLSTARLIAFAELSDANSLRSIMCRLRAALVDTGFAARIRCRPSLGGYIVSREEAAELWERVLDELGLAA